MIHDTDEAGRHRPDCACGVSDGPVKAEMPNEKLTRLHAEIASLVAERDQLTDRLARMSEDVLRVLADNARYKAALEKHRENDHRIGQERGCGLCKALTPAPQEENAQQKPPCPTCGWTFVQAAHIFGDNLRCPDPFHLIPAPQEVGNDG